MSTQPRKQNPVGPDGLTKQQRYYQVNRIQINTANALRMKAKRQESKASKTTKTENYSVQASLPECSGKVMKDEAIDATEVEETATSHGRIGCRVMNDKEVDATRGSSAPSDDVDCVRCQERITSCERCELILRQHAPIEEFFQIKHLLEKFKSHVLQVTMGLQAELAE